MGAKPTDWSRRFAVAALAAMAAAGVTARAASPPQPAFDAAALAQRPGLRALVVARGGCVLLEYYGAGAGPQTRFPVYSVTKSVLSLLVGVAVDRGALRLDQTLSDWLPEAANERVDPLARAVTIRDLMTMTAGFAPAQAPQSAPTVRALLERRMACAPGDRFAYDGMAADLLSVVLARAIRGDSAAFARRSLLDPLGVRNYAWTADADGRLFGETNLALTARDMAKIGLLALQRGRWGGRRIVSEGFMREATMRRSAGGAPLGAAYGYLWWVTKTRAGFDAFFAAGSGGQLVYVAPALGLVAAVAAQPGGGDNLDLIETVALPAAAGAPSSAPCLARLGPGE